MKKKAILLGIVIFVYLHINRPSFQPKYNLETRVEFISSSISGSTAPIFKRKSIFQLPDAFVKKLEVGKRNEVPKDFISLGITPRNSNETFPLIKPSVPIQQIHAADNYNYNRIIQR